MPLVAPGTGRKKKRPKYRTGGKSLFSTMKVGNNLARSVKPVRPKAEVSSGKEKGGATKRSEVTYRTA